MQYHAFLSYSHHDTDMMRQVREGLTDAGLNVWTDESLIPGTPSWKNTIEEAIQNTMTLVVLLSPDAKHSDWIEKEVEYAQACNVTILPVLIRGADEISAVPFELINVQRLDFRQNFEGGMVHLIDTIKSEGEPHIFSAPLQHSTPQADIEELNPVSIYDHVRLFVWLFWQPQTLIQYRQLYGDETLRRTAAWLVADLAWIAFFAPAIGIVLGTVQIATDVPTTSTAMQAISGLVFLGGWTMTGLLGWRDNSIYAAILLVCTTVIMLGLFALVSTLSGVVLSEAGGMTRPAFLFLTGIMLSSGAGIAFRMANIAGGAIAGLLLSSLLFNAIFGIQLHLDGGITAFIMFIVAILVAYVVDLSLNTGERTIFHQICFVLISLSGALMIITYFLGGWLFLLNLG
ncbi:MAG: hypothetical protein Phog2KO_31180 [Phototrophicaceae bacterium]